MGKAEEININQCPVCQCIFDSDMFEPCDCWLDWIEYYDEMPETEILYGREEY